MARRAAAAPATAAKAKKGAPAAKAAAKKKKSAASSSPTPPSDRKTRSSTAGAAKKNLAPDHAPSAARPTPASSKTLATASDLKDLAASGIDNLKRRMDAFHSEAFKEITGPFSYVSKRIKAQSQACQQLAEESEKEYKKSSDKINEDAELVKASFVELISEAQAAASRVRKVTIPELEKSMEKAIGYLRSQYKIPAITS